MDHEYPVYNETPVLPDTEYSVHDPKRPQPSHVMVDEPIRTSPPSDATVLFDGSDLEEWEHSNGDSAAWNVDDGVLVVEPGEGDIQTKTSIGDCQLHIEWRTSENLPDTWDRGNSGVFLQDRYEVQVFDSSADRIYADGHAGAVYGQHPPEVNPCRAPGKWQSFDIVWHSPRFDEGNVIEPATLTLLFNGVLVQDGVELYGQTNHTTFRPFEEHGPAPLRLQEHGDCVRFRNIWYRD
jgi:hypothetical protein